MTRVDVETIRDLKAQLRAINELPFEDIEFYEMLSPLEIPKEIREHWKFIGMNNADFIDTDFYKDGFSDDIVELVGNKIISSKEK
jgi:hypothetical protein